MLRVICGGWSCIKIKANGLDYRLNWNTVLELNPNSGCYLGTFSPIIIALGWTGSWKIEWPESTDHPAALSAVLLLEIADACYQISTSTGSQKTWIFTGMLPIILLLLFCISIRKDDGWDFCTQAVKITQAVFAWSLSNICSHLETLFLNIPCWHHLALKVYVLSMWLSS